MSGGHDSDHGHAKEAKKPSPKLPLRPIFTICIIVGLCIWVGWCTMQGAKAPNGNVQTGPVQQPAQAAPVSSCSSKNTSITAPAGGARTQWVPIPSGCGVVPGAGRGYRYGVECVNHQGSIALDGVCAGPASAERYYSKESGSVSIPVEFGPTS